MECRGGKPLSAGARRQGHRGHDGFRISEPNGATPSPLAGLFPYDHPASEAERKATLDISLDPWRDYVDAPLFPALYATWAVMAGDRALSLELFEEGYAAYAKGRFHQCLAYRPDHPNSKGADRAELIPA